MTRSTLIRLSAACDPAEALSSWLAEHATGLRSLVWLTPTNLHDDARSRLPAHPAIVIASPMQSPWQSIPTLAIVGISAGWDRVQRWIDRADSVLLVLSANDPIPECWPEEYETLTVSSPGEPRDVAIRHEAPGELGECRMAARQIRHWLDDGLDPAKVIITARQTHPLRSRLCESLADCGIALSDHSLPDFDRLPIIATLLRAWRLPSENFPFTAVCDLLRSNFLKRPTDDPELPRRSVMLLRQLGRTRGKRAFLDAIEQWAISPPQPLEDEGAETPRRERVGRLAGICRPFLIDFFATWDRIPAAAKPSDWVTALQAFAESLFGVHDDVTSFCDDIRTAAKENDDESWIGKEFDDWLRTVAKRPSNRVVLQNRRAVRFVSVNVARNLPCDALVILGLGEGSFPLPTLTSPEELRDERRLFRDLLDRPRRFLLLSRAATDELGNELLPSSFLSEYAANHPELPPPVRFKLLIEGFAEGEAFAASERRTQAARRLRFQPTYPLPGSGLTDDLIASLRRSQIVASERFGSGVFNSFDGQLSHPESLALVQTRFHPDRPFSPSALETYVACPFKFWMGKVLNVDELTEPTEEIEASRRGQALHRALARYHRNDARGDLHGEIATAIREYADQSGSLLGHKLWTLETRRLERTARKYAPQWNKFREPWTEKELDPTPARFEQSFGNPRNPEGINEPLVLRHGGTVVKITGTIDRIDTVEHDGELGFWIVDYKTGRSDGYTSKAVEKFEALQLPLYAMAVERVIFADRDQAVRPLGLVYWFLAGDGPKAVLTKGWSSSQTDLFSKPGIWITFRRKVEEVVTQQVTQIRAGRFPLDPIDEQCTRSCPYSMSCRIAQSRNLGKQRAE